MPVNLRPPEWRQEVFGNFASWVTIWVRPEQGEDLNSVATRVAARTRPVKHDRLVVGEDDVLLREGIARLLAEAGFDVVAQAGIAVDLVRKALAHRPDVAVVDIQMPPGHVDDGLRAALELGAKLPDMGVLVLSQYYEERYAIDLIGDSAEGVGYLLKERVGDVDAVGRVAAGGSALDPEIVGRMLGRRRQKDPWTS